MGETSGVGEGEDSGAGVGEDTGVRTGGVAEPVEASSVIFICEIVSNFTGESDFDESGTIFKESIPQKSIPPLVFPVSFPFVLLSFKSVSF